MTGDEVRKIAERGFVALAENRFDDFFATVHPEAVLVTDPQWLDGGRFEGVPAFRRFIDEFTEAFTTVRFVYEAEPEVIGSQVLFRGSWVGAGAASGIAAPSPPFSVVFSGRDGMLTDVRFFFAEANARAFIADRQAGE
jgi:hypothetical protein